MTREDIRKASDIIYNIDRLEYEIKSISDVLTKRCWPKEAFCIPLGDTFSNIHFSPEEIMAKADDLFREKKQLLLELTEELEGLLNKH